MHDLASATAHQSTLSATGVGRTNPSNMTKFFATLATSYLPLGRLMRSLLLPVLFLASAQATTGQLEGFSSAPEGAEEMPELVLALHMLVRGTVYLEAIAANSAPQVDPLQFLPELEIFSCRQEGPGFGVPAAGAADGQEGCTLF